jgi:hypothetical protein
LSSLKAEKGASRVGSPDTEKRKNVDLYKVLEEEMKEFEDRLMVGGVPKENSSAVGHDSVDSSPEIRIHKKPKIQDGVQVLL